MHPFMAILIFLAILYIFRLCLAAGILEEFTRNFVWNFVWMMPQPWDFPSDHALEKFQWVGYCVVLHHQIVWTCFFHCLWCNFMLAYCFQIDNVHDMGAYRSIKAIAGAINTAKYYSYNWKFTLKGLKAWSEGNLMVGGHHWETSEQNSTWKSLVNSSKIPAAEQSLSDFFFWISTLFKRPTRCATCDGNLWLKVYCYTAKACCSTLNDSSCVQGEFEKNFNM